MTKELKHDILEKLAEVIYAFDAYPTKEDLAAVAQALVETHPCPKEAGSPSGCLGWKNSLKFRLEITEPKCASWADLTSLSIVVNVEDTPQMATLQTRTSRSQGKEK